MRRLSDAEDELPSDGCAFGCGRSDHGASVHQPPVQPLSDSEDELPFDGRAFGCGSSHDGTSEHRPALTPVSALASVPSPSGLRGRCSAE